MELTQYPDGDIKLRLTRADQEKILQWLQSYEPDMLLLPSLLLEKEDDGE